MSIGRPGCSCQVYRPAYSSYRPLALRAGYENFFFSPLPLFFSSLYHNPKCQNLYQSIIMSDENISQNTISEFNSFIDPELLSQSVLDTFDNISTFTQSDSQVIFEPKWKNQKSFIWLPENGEKYLEKGKWRWRCYCYL